LSHTGSTAENSSRGPGRPRDEAARQRILKAALDLMEELAFAQVTAEAIAARAGVSKATIYRWWPNKAAVVIEAFRETFAPQLPLPNEGTLRDDLARQLRDFARLLSGSGGRMLRSFIVAARSDPEVATAFRDIWRDPRRNEGREMLRQKREAGQLRGDADLDLALDVLFGPLYYCFLVKNEPPSQKYGEAIAELVIRGLASGGR
jgi:AcrR family transcriptional regulator